MLLSFWLWAEQHGGLHCLFPTPWDQLERSPSTSQREKPSSRSQIGPRPATTAQPAFCPAPAWSRLEALIMFAGSSFRFQPGVPAPSPNLGSRISMGGG